MTKMITNVSLCLLDISRFLINLNLLVPDDIHVLTPWDSCPSFSKTLSS